LAPLRAGGFVGNQRAHSSFRPGEVLRVREQEEDVDDPVGRAAGSLEDRLDVAHRLAGLLLDRVADDRPGLRVERSLAGDEDEPAATTAWLNGNGPAALPVGALGVEMTRLMT
jgi:hypothetical protein